MKKPLTFASIMLFSSQVLASSNTQFVAVDTTLETNLCLVAATQGIDAARNTVDELSKHEFEAIICNNKSIVRFASQHRTKSIKNADTKVTAYKFKTLDNSVETQLCAVAAQQGIEKARLIGGRNFKNIVCNGRSIAYFAKKYSNI